MVSMNTGVFNADLRDQGLTFVRNERNADGKISSIYTDQYARPASSVQDMINQLFRSRNVQTANPIVTKKGKEVSVTVDQQFLSKYEQAAKSMLGQVSTQPYGSWDQEGEEKARGATTVKAAFFDPEGTERELRILRDDNLDQPFVLRELWSSYRVPIISSSNARQFLHDKPNNSWLLRNEGGLFFCYKDETGAYGEVSNLGQGLSTIKRVLEKEGKNYTNDVRRELALKRPYSYFKNEANVFNIFEPGSKDEVDRVVFTTPSGERLMSREGVLRALKNILPNDMNREHYMTELQKCKIEEVGKGIAGNPIFEVTIPKTLLDELDSVLSPDYGQPVKTKEDTEAAKQEEVKEAHATSKAAGITLQELRKNMVFYVPRICTREEAQTYLPQKAGSWLVRCTDNEKGEIKITQRLGDGRLIHWSEVGILQHLTLHPGYFKSEDNVQIPVAAKHPIVRAPWLMDAIVALSKTADRDNLVADKIAQLLVQNYGSNDRERLEAIFRDKPVGSWLIRRSGDKNYAIVVKILTQNPETKELEERVLHVSNENAEYFKSNIAKNDYSLYVFEGADLPS